jgi:hypothetical protein
LLFVQFVFDTCVNTLDAFSFCHLFFVFFFFHPRARLPGQRELLVFGI